MGVPAPAGAALVLQPLAWSFHFGDEFKIDDSYVALYIIFISFLLVSRTPTFSSKMINKAFFGGIIKRSFIGICVGGFLVVSCYSPWVSSLITAGLYVLSFPFSYWYFGTLKRKNC